MRIGKNAWAVAIVTLALCVPAAASAKVVTYGGELAPEGRIAIDVKVKKKKPKEIVEIRFVEVPVTCESSGPLAVWAKLPSPGLEVRKGEFTYKTRQPQYGNVKKITGDFAKRGKVIRGQLNYSNHFPEEPEFPEEDCRTKGSLSYSANRGGKDVVVPPPGEAASRRG